MGPLTPNKNHHNRECRAPSGLVFCRGPRRTQGVALGWNAAPLRGFGMGRAAGRGMSTLRGRAQGAMTVWGVSSLRGLGGFLWGLGGPRALPWAGMPRPFGASGWGAAGRGRSALRGFEIGRASRGDAPALLRSGQPPAWPGHRPEGAKDASPGRSPGNGAPPHFFLTPKRRRIQARRATPGHWGVTRARPHKTTQ